MDSRSSRLLSGRRVPSRHSARFISRSALAMAIDALRLPMVLDDVDRTAPRWRGKSRGPMPGQAWAPGGRDRSYDDQTPRRSTTKISVSPGLIAGVGLWLP